MKVPCAWLLILIPVPSALFAQGMGQHSPRPAESELTSPDLDASLAGTRLEALIRLGRWDDAGALADEATHQQPDSRSAWYALGLVRFNQLKYTQALRALRRAEQLAPENPEVHRLLGLTYYLLEQYHLFEEQMQRGKASQPDNGEFDYLLGRYYHLAVGDCARAISSFDRAISLHFTSFKVLYNRGDCYDQSGDLPRAEKDFLAAIEQIRAAAARDSWPFQALAGLYLRTDRVDEAVSLAREAVRLDGESDAGHVLLAKALAEKGQLPAAISELRQAARLKPMAEGTRYQLYRLYLRLGDREAAEKELAVFRQILAADGGDAANPQ